MSTSESRSKEVGHITQKKARVLNSPIVYLLATLYAGVVIGAFLATVSEMRVIESILDKTAYLGFSFVFFINATSLLLFYIYIVAPVELSRGAYALTATGSFVFVVFYLAAFLVLPRGYLSYSIGLIGLGIVYLVAWIKYLVVFRELRKMIVSGQSTHEQPSMSEDVNDILDRYMFVKVMRRNMYRTGTAFSISTALGIIIIVGHLVPSLEWSENDSWLLSASITVFAFYMIFVVVWNVWQILNPDSLERFEISGNEFFSKFDTPHG